MRQNPKFSTHNEYKIQNFVLAASNILVKQDQLISIYSSIIGAKIDAFGRIRHTLYRTQVCIGGLNMSYWELLDPSLSPDTNLS